MTNPQPPVEPNPLLDIGRALCAAPDTTAQLEILASAAAKLTASEAASILALEDGGETLSFVALPDGHRAALGNHAVPVAQSLAGWVVQNGKPLTVRDVSTEARHYKGADQATGFTTRSLMAVPIIFQGEVLGVLEAINRQPHAEPAAWPDEAVLEYLASLAALILHNARLAGLIQKPLAEMQHLDRMKSDFIAIASHELRTPLGLILGHATFLREVIQGEHRAQLDVMVRNAMRLKEIIDSIATLDNVEHGQATLRLGDVSIRKVIEEVSLSLHDEAAEKGITLMVESKGDEALIEGDAVKIGVALANLVKNALTFSDPGDHVLIKSEALPGQVRVSVSDDGVGIPATDLPHIFERFYQVESHLTRKHGGMGLGLSLAKILIELHGGRIWAESVEGRGSRFSFVLPVRANQAQGDEAGFPG